MKGCVNIIGGKYKGKKILFPSDTPVRPTPNRVRETLFNWLMHDVREAVCLDAFAGSGALGLEAFSRGAAQVDFLEVHEKIYQYLNKLLASFSSSALKAYCVDALSFLKNTQKTYDLIFLDPPFHADLLLPCLTILAHSPILRAGGLVYIESAVPVTLSALEWEPIKIKQSGQVFYSLIRKQKADAGE